MSKLKSKVYAIIIKSDGKANIGDRERKPCTDEKQDIAGEAISFFHHKDIIQTNQFHKDKNGEIMKFYNFFRRKHEPKQVYLLNNPLIHLEKGIKKPKYNEEIQTYCPSKE